MSTGPRGFHPTTSGRWATKSPALAVLDVIDSSMSALSQFFLNPAFVLPGAALILLPILIHILSRLRYRQIRFAAMEFLLESEELNRRRLILEQLLQLLLRILIVLLIVLLISRLILDPGRL
ncbi:MAG: BatA domain-containing protein, partial [Planctomycetaceae bacterium]